MHYDEPTDDYDDYAEEGPSTDDGIDMDEEWVYKRDYDGPTSVIEGLINEWLHVTYGHVPVFGWPLEDRITAGFRGRIPVEEHTEISEKVIEFFDGDQKACIFPVKRVLVIFVADTTRVTVVGDRSRAMEMIPNAG